MPARTEPTRDQAKAWIRNIFPPVIGALDIELAWLRRGRPSWRFHSADLEYLAPLRERLYKAAHPLLDQFFRYYPEIAEQERRHDMTLGLLRNACFMAQSALESDQEFVAAVDEVDRDFQSSDAPGERRWHGAFPPEDRARLAAEYVVNGVRPDEVPSGDTTRDFWLRHGHRLLQYRVQHASIVKDLENAIAAARDATDDLRAALMASRDDLADRHGLPAAIVGLD